MTDLQLKEPNITVKSFVHYIKDSRYSMVPVGTPQTALEFLAVANAFGGEAGELQNIVKKIIKADCFLTNSELHDEFVLEAGDALHYLLSLIDLAGYNVEYIMACNVRKLDERKMRNEAQANETVLSSTPTQHAA